LKDIYVAKVMNLPSPKRFVQAGVVVLKAHHDAKPQTVL
jgi:hypothetical protein